jgi:hypothetical protein
MAWKGKSCLALIASFLMLQGSRWCPTETAILTFGRNEYSAAKSHRIFGFGRILGNFTYFRPKVTDLLPTHSKIG